jgi:pimeloyl-ACP methyl ester carboxylesterase
MAASLSDWARLAPELAENGLAAYALDLLGHGGSAKPDDPRHYHIDALYRHFHAWIESLGLVEPAIIVGHSLGGYLGLLFAMRQPQGVRGLVLIDPYYEKQQLSPLLQLVSRQPALGEKAMRVTPQWMIHAVMGWNPDAATHFSPQVRQQIAADYKRASPHFVYITRDMPDLNAGLEGVTVPTLVVWGEHDLTLYPSSFRRLVRVIPNATACPIAHTGHQPHISKPALVNRSILEFIHSLP